MLPKLKINLNLKRFKAAEGKIIIFRYKMASSILCNCEVPKIRIDRAEQVPNTWQALMEILSQEIIRKRMKRNLKQGRRQKDAKSTWTVLHKMKLEIMNENP